MADRWRIGVAGCGAIARLVHIPLLSRRSDVEIRALADPDAAALAAARAAVPAAHCFASLDEMLAAGGLDAAVVALPSGDHAAAATAVLAAGCDLYLEKPLASERAGAEAVLAAWRAGDRMAMLGFSGRFNPLYRRLRTAIRSGRAGRPVVVRSVFTTAPRDTPEWKRHRATGGGALLDLGAHHIDLMCFLFGREPVAVRATLESRASEADTALLEIDLADGPRVQSFFSLAAAEHDRVEVYGDRARLAVARATSLDVAVTDNPGHGGGVAGRAFRRAGALRHLGGALRARRSPLREPGYAVALDHFVAALGSRRLPADAADPADGALCLAVIEAAERSAVSGRVEAVGRPAHGAAAYGATRGAEAGA